MLVRKWNKWNSHSLLVRVQSGTTILKNSLSVSLKSECVAAIWFSPYIPRYLPKRSESMYPYKCLYKSSSHFGSVDSALALGLKGSRFSFGQGHISPLLREATSQGVLTSILLSLSFPLPSTLSKKINGKKILVMFIAYLFSVKTIRNSCPPKNEWINKLVWNPTKQATVLSNVLPLNDMDHHPSSFQ